MFFGAWTLAAAVVWSQEARPTLNSLAIVGARIETRPGEVIEKGSVLCQDGKIVAVGPSLTLPAGTETIDGTGLFVYAGFVDFGVTQGLKEPSSGVRQTEIPDPSQDFETSMSIWSPGLHADWIGADLYDPDDAFWKGERSAGFTTALVYPPSGIVKGQASLVNLDGRGRLKSVVRDCVGLFIGLEGLSGTYPGTVLGAFSTVRQSYADVTWWEQTRSDYDKGSGPRPVDSPHLEALSRLREKGVPVLFDANEAWKINSVLSFAQELRVNPIVFGARESRHVAKEGWIRVKRLDFPPDPDEAKPKEGELKEPEQKVKERRRLWLEKVNNSEASAYTTQGCKDQATFFKNLRSAVKEGVPRTSALGALTSLPHKILGIEGYGEVAPRFAANLTVMTKDFLDPEAKVKFLVIDGKKIDPAKEPFKFSNAVSQFGGGR